MPVIINEIQITAYVSEQNNSTTATAAVTAPAPQAQQNQKGDEKIIKTCVEEVLRILKEKQER